MPFHLSRILGGAIFAVLLTATLAACSRQPAAQPAPPPAVTITAPTAPPAIATAQATSRPAPTAAPAATSAPQSASSTAPTATIAQQSAAMAAATAAATAAPTAATSAEQASQAGSPAVFSLGEGTIARYKVEEVLARAGFKVATGETSEVEGQIVFDAEGGIVSDESRIVIQAGALTTDSDRRDRYVRERTLQTAEYPEVIFRPTSAEGLPLPLSEAGGEVEFTISGDLTIRDQTRPVTWDVAAEFGDGISGLATIDITFKQFAMDKPSVAIVVSVGDTFSLELDFVGSIEQIAAMNTDDDDDDMAAGTSDEPDIADEAYAQVLGSEDALVTVVEFSDFQ